MEQLRRQRQGDLARAGVVVGVVVRKAGVVRARTLCWDRLIWISEASKTQLDKLGGEYSTAVQGHRRLPLFLWDTNTNRVISSGGTGEICWFMSVSVFL